MNIKITAMYLDGHSVPVPEGLSELINSAGAWGTPKRNPMILEKYERKVERRGENWVTIFTFKKTIKEV